MGIERINKINYYLNIASQVMERGTCLRRRYGAVIVKDDRIISTGYNGAPRKRKDCLELGYCLRVNLKIKSGRHAEICFAVHAEENAIINSNVEDRKGSTLYLWGENRNKSGRKEVTGKSPCILCKKAVINAGIKDIIIKTTEGYRIDTVDSYLNDADMKRIRKAFLCGEEMP